MSINNTNPIGFFDSGVGGTTIWREVVDLLPFESTVYLADSKNAPYGNKSSEEIIYLCKKNTEVLLELNAKIIVVACNTATTNAITYLREQYAIPFIGIEPAIKPALLNTQTQSIGVLATKGTLSSQLFHKTVASYLKDYNIQIIEQEGEGLVELIEGGMINSLEMEELLSEYINRLMITDIDYLVLGCTHYPYLKPIIKKILPKEVIILDSGLAVAKQTQRILQKYNLLNSNQCKPKHNWYTNKNFQVLESFLPNIVNVEIDYLDF